MTKYPYASVSQLNVPNDLVVGAGAPVGLIYLGKSTSRLTFTKRSSPSWKTRDREQNACRISGSRPRSRGTPSMPVIWRHWERPWSKTPGTGATPSRRSSQDAQTVIDIAKAYGAVGWKVNGAGSEGGSVTLLCPALSYVKREMIQAIEAENPLYRSIPVT